MQLTLVLQDDPSILVRNRILFYLEGCPFDDVLVGGITLDISEDRLGVGIPLVEGRPLTNRCVICHVENGTNLQLVAFQILAILDDRQDSPTTENDFIPIFVGDMIRLP